jgi:hypothetical protein
MPKDKRNITKLGRKYCTTIYSCHKAVISIQILQRGKQEFLSEKPKLQQVFKKGLFILRKQNLKKIQHTRKGSEKNEEKNNIFLLEPFVIYEYP